MINFLKSADLILRFMEGETVGRKELLAAIRNVKEVTETAIKLERKSRAKGNERG